MITKKELLEDFGEYLQEAIEVYCQEMELDEEATRFLLQAINEAGPLNYMRSRSQTKKVEKEEEGKKSTKKEEVEIDQGRLGLAFRQYVTEHTFVSIEEAINAFCQTHNLGDVNRQKLVDYVNETQGKSSTSTVTGKMYTPTGAKKTSLSEEVSPVMQRYLRALGC